MVKLDRLTRSVKDLGVLSETIDTFYVHWGPPMLWEIETDAGFGLEDLMQELGR